MMTFKSIYAQEFQCKFEEVYSDSEVQSGFFLFKKQKFRYQYNDKNLFTIFLLGNEFFLSKNSNRDIYQNITEKNIIITELKKIIADYPQLKSEYVTNSLKINLEYSKSFDFLKRISFTSKELSLSIFFYECSKKQIPDRFFILNPFYEYKP